MCAYGGALCLLVAAAAAMGELLLDGHLWAGALVVAGALFVPAVIAGVIGWRKRLTNTMPRTRAELSKEITWAKYRTT